MAASGTSAKASGVEFCSSVVISRSNMAFILLWRKCQRKLDAFFDPRTKLLASFDSICFNDQPTFHGFTCQVKGFCVGFLEQDSVLLGVNAYDQIILVYTTSHVPI